MPKDLSNRVISIIQLKLTLSQEKSSYADAIIGTCQEIYPELSNFRHTGRPR